jgi:hypothetical protein
MAALSPRKEVLQQFFRCGEFNETGRCYTLSVSLV